MQSPIITVMTDKLEQSIEFYKNILGFSLNSRVDLDDVTLQFLQFENMTVELVQLKNGPKLTTGNTVVLTFLVESFDSIIAKLVTTDEPLPSPITLPSGVQMLRFTDPSGVPISFVIESSISH